MVLALQRDGQRVRAHILEDTNDRPSACRVRPGCTVGDVAAERCAHERVGRQVAERLRVRVRDAMLTAPKTLTVDASVGDVRRAFANPHVLSVLLVDGRVFAGALERGDVPAEECDERPAHELAHREVVTIRPDAPLAAALSKLDERGEQRLVVLDPDGQTLRGLLCLTSGRDGFCQATPNVP